MDTSQTLMTTLDFDAIKLKIQHRFPAKISIDCDQFHALAEHDVQFRATASDEEGS